MPVQVQDSDIHYLIQETVVPATSAGGYCMHGFQLNTFQEQQFLLAQLLNK